MKVKVGDRVVVCGYGHAFPIVVKSIEWVPEEARTVLNLDWGPEHGTSRVFDYDEGKVWYQLKNLS